ncbi:DUF2982 domain-containing protein [Shewanella sp. NIFS-20-20]|uniref:DUF2982 domain-containing protein n=1 Tax=Shewanella sp. NIFS-20-20 TaxID=2853806 RepID=UPI001C46FAB7|nr:DUF2982 domain-containing protein [Shewanella sp. NIFS-20-20]MBV7314853.1 DUF2982 domain-containing protein [Shewanella sp. NIFS-20-20]
MLDTHVAMRPQAKRNGITLSLVGAILLVVGLCLFVMTPHWFGPALLSFTFGVLGLVIGLSKVREPEVSVALSAEGFTFYHRRGQVFVAWSNVQRLDSLRVSQAMTLVELPYLGVKLKRINPVLDNISLRLATGLLSEQRPLLMTAATQDEDLSDYEQQVALEFTPLVVDGERYRGVLAMFGHRSIKLQQVLGYHLYLPADSFDRPLPDAITLLKQYHQQYSG